MLQKSLLRYRVLSIYSSVFHLSTVPSFFPYIIPCVPSIIPSIVSFLASSIIHLSFCHSICCSTLLFIFLNIYHSIYPSQSICVKLKWLYCSQAIESGDADQLNDSSSESDTDMAKGLDSNDDNSLDNSELQISPIRNGMMKKSRRSTSGKFSSLEERSRQSQEEHLHEKNV